LMKSDLLLENMTEPAFVVSDDRVVYASPSARYFLPELVPEEPVPDYLDIVKPRGEFSRGGLDYFYHRIDSAEGSMVLFWPKIQQVLTGWQVEGVIRQMRELLARMMLSGRTADGAFRRDFCQMFRLVDHMDFLYRASREDDIQFQPITMDLAGLCRRTMGEAAPLLHAAGVETQLEISCASMLISGDPELLQQMLYGLFSNGAKAVQRDGGQLYMRLRPLAGHALLTVSNVDSLGAEERMLSLVPDRNVDQPPRPEDGAGMGLAMIRHIAHLHGGAVLTERRGEQMVACVRLPTGPLNSRLQVRSPRMETGGGIPMVVVELSDVLPASVYEMEDFLE